MVDASSSINGEELELVKKFVTSVFHSFSFDDDVRYGLVVFGDRVEVITSTNHSTVQIWS